MTVTEAEGHLPNPTPIPLPSPLLASQLPDNLLGLAHLKISPSVKSNTGFTVDPWNMFGHLLDICYPRS